MTPQFQLLHQRMDPLPWVLALPYWRSSQSTLSPPLLHWQRSWPILPPLWKLLARQGVTQNRNVQNGWKVHLSHMVASVGSIPCNLGDLRQCCHNHRFSQQKRAWHLLEEEQWALRGISSSASSGSSPELAPKEEEDQGAKPRCHFWDSKKSQGPWLQANPRNWRLTVLGLEWHKNCLSNLQWSQWSPPLCARIRPQVPFTCPW